MTGPWNERRTVKSLVLLAVILMCSAILPVQLASGTIFSGASEFDAPSGLAFGGGHLWVTNEAGNSVSEINPSSGSWIASFDAKKYEFRQPTAITRDGPDLFVANAAGSVSEMRASDGAFVRTISGPRYHFSDPVAIEAAGSFILVVNNGQPNAATPSAGSLTEISARTGSLVRTVSGSLYDLANPTALAVSGPVVLIADKGYNSVTEVRIASGRLIRVVGQQGLNAPDGIAVVDGNAWVADGASSAVTEFAVATGAVINTFTDSDGSYGFGSPSMVIGAGGSVFVASPFGSSPMVTKVSATNGQPSWYMCNTNGPYYFSLLSAFAVAGSDLWVASRSGANSATPGAQTGSLTELSTGDGALMTTLPKPTTSVTTTTVWSTTTTSLP